MVWSYKTWSADLFQAFTIYTDEYSPGIGVNRYQVSDFSFFSVVDKICPSDFRKFVLNE